MYQLYVIFFKLGKKRIKEDYKGRRMGEAEKEREERLKSGKNEISNKR